MLARLGRAAVWLLASASLTAAVLAPLPAAAQERPSPAQEPAPPAPPIMRLPGLEVTSSRLPSTPLPASSVPAAVDVIPGAELRATGAPTLQEALCWIAGVTTADPQGNSFHMDLSFRGF